MLTCNFIVTDSRYDPNRPKGQRKIPAVRCGEPATHTLPPRHALKLCAKHAQCSWGSPPPEAIAPATKGGA